ncbi:hypothetical protein CERSUDRAFT_107843 [Gelatoporia subvermispora B]|uniref:Autophagy-related protein 17 n=1 Tax=Ceriporiopsis subvermispora (strain B) TaxID=914234 RepID=M2R6W2_CERS8|nr:hypothetical protein CERSUDRAFT_107843 [Gelatoporia subvermispora B]
MTTPVDSTAATSDQPHLVSLVLQSKKALQHGEMFCSRASILSSSSAQVAVDVLALDAKVRWLSNAVLEQLELAAHVAKSIEQKRGELERQAEAWDAARTERTDALDTVLESLSGQVVPPDFYTTATELSPFGSQHTSDAEHDPDDTAPFGDPLASSPTETVRNDSRFRRTLGVARPDRSTWKTLRDFVDERKIEDVLDSIESDRSALDDILARTSDYPESLFTTISAIRTNAPVEIIVPSIDDIFSSQEAASAKMAGHLESLAAHYDQMSDALSLSEAGEEYTEDDLQDMNRDTDELPAIIAELEESILSIEATNNQLLGVKKAAQQQLETHRQTLDDLDELGEIMTEMLERQQDVEAESSKQLALMHQHLMTIEGLQHRFTSYQYAYNKLLLELARRRQYQDAAERIVEGMISQLDAMTEEERLLREEFNAEHGQYLPEDVCLFIQNAPTRWTVITRPGEHREVVPGVEQDLLLEVS